MKKSEIIYKVEDSIFEIAKQFSSGENSAFYFRNESDIQCRLFDQISRKLGDIELVHAEQRIEGSRSWYDLVVWKPDMKEQAARNWNKINSDFAEELPNLNLVVIEIKHFYGGISKAREYASTKSIRNHQDIKNLIKAVRRGGKYAYFIMFWDENVKNNEKYINYFNKIEAAFTTFRKQKNLNRIRILCKTRDGKQFNLGF